MARKFFPLLLATALCLSFSFNGSQISFAGNSDLKPEDVVAAHLKSIGTPEVLESVKNRGIAGVAKVNFVQGGTGNMEGQSLIVSAGPNLGFVMKFGGVEYPGENFAFDGSEVTVSNISPGQRSPLGDFIYRYNIIMKEGLFGGVLSVGWPLLDISKRDPSLKYKEGKFDGRKVHELQYSAKSGMNDMKIKLYFDFDTFRHVGTEYRLKVQGEQALQIGQTVTEGVMRVNEDGTRSGVVTRDVGILDAVHDSIYLLVERFDNFKEVKFGKGSEAKSMMLPHSYSIQYSNEGHGSTFLANWNVEASQWIQNGKIDASFFRAQ